MVTARWAIPINPTGGLPIPQARPYEGRADGHGSGCTPSGVWCGTPQQSRAAAGAVVLLAIRSGAPNVALAALDDKRQVPKGRG